MHAAYPDGDEPPPPATALIPDVPDGRGPFVPGELLAGAVAVPTPGCCVSALGCALGLGCVIKGEASIALRPVPGVMKPTSGAGVPRPPGAVLAPGWFVEGDVLGVIALTPVPAS